MRKSNIELLRIVAMFMVVLVHSNFWSLGIPTMEDLSNNTLPTYFRYLFESLTIISVNEFILISGYFTIKFSIKGLFNFLFICLFYSIIFLIIHSIINRQIYFTDIYKSLFLTSDYWFIKSYLALYLISPILNSFIEKVTYKSLTLFIIFFYIYQTYFNLLEDSTGFINNGYSVWSFIGLYFIGYYLKNYQSYFTQLSKVKLTLYYIIISVVISILAIMGKLYLGNEMLFYKYNSPLVILSSIFFFILFTKINFQNKIINTIAVSTFSVYLIHVNLYFREYFFQLIKSIYNETNGILCVLSIISFAIFIYGLSILIDQIRIFIWNIIYSRIKDFIAQQL